MPLSGADVVKIRDTHVSLRPGRYAAKNGTGVHEFVRHHSYHMVAFFNDTCSDEL